MTNWEDLKNSIAQVIRENGMQEITGDALQAVLISIISNVGMNATYAGVATASTNPGNPDGPVFYLAGTAGTYSNFGGITLDEGESAVLKFNNGAWTKEALPFATQEQVTELENAKEFYLEQGTIIYNTGLPKDSDTRVRTAYFVPAQNVKITTTNGLQMYLYKYTNNGEFKVDETVYEATSVVLADFDRCYKITFRKENGLEPITVDEVLANIEITYEVNDSIKQLINAGYLFIGFANTETIPTTTEIDCFYIATEIGAYTNFGNIFVANKMSFLLRKSNIWSVKVSDIMSFDDVINLCKPSLIDMSINMQKGYYITTIGEELSDFNPNTYYRTIKIDDSKNGDTFIISGTSGNTGRLYAKVKDGIVIETSNEGFFGNTKVIITKDDSFDTIVFNVDHNKPYQFLKVISSVDIQTMTNDLYGLNIEYLGSIWEKGFIPTNISTPIASFPSHIDDTWRYIEIPCKEGDTFNVSVKNGNTARGWNFLREDRTVIEQASGSYSRITVNITAPAESYSLLLNTQDTTDESFVKKVVTPIWERENKQNLSGLKIAYLGDSAIDVGNKEWPQWCSKLLGAEYQVFATGGYTYANQFTDEGKTTYKNCLKLLVDRLLAYSTENNWIPDIIVLQIGGNDLYLIDKLGTLEDAFADFNYKTLQKDDTTYGGIRYNLQRLGELFPNAYIIVGTVFQRREDDASKIAIPVREVCAKLGVSVIDGNKYSGISSFEELKKWPIYSDNPDGLNIGSREYPQYNWVEPDGTIVTVDAKTDDAVKKYGKYTFDGTHKTIKAEKHIAIFMASQISSYCGFNAKFIDTHVVE